MSQKEGEKLRAAAKAGRLALGVVEYKGKEVAALVDGVDILAILMLGVPTAQHGKLTRGAKVHFRNIMPVLKDEAWDLQYGDIRDNFAVLKAEYNGSHRTMGLRAAVQ